MMKTVIISLSLISFLCLCSGRTQFKLLQDGTTVTRRSSRKFDRLAIKIKYPNSVKGGFHLENSHLAIFMKYPVPCTIVQGILSLFMQLNDYSHSTCFCEFSKN